MGYSGNSTWDTSGYIRNSTWDTLGNTGNFTWDTPGYTGNSTWDTPGYIRNSTWDTLGISHGIHKKKMGIPHGIHKKKMGISHGIHQEYTENSTWDALGIPQLPQERRISDLNQPQVPSLSKPKLHDPINPLQNLPKSNLLPSSHIFTTEPSTFPNRKKFPLSPSQIPHSQFPLEFTWNSRRGRC